MFAMPIATDCTGGAVEDLLLHAMMQAFDLAVLKLKRPVTAVGGYFNYDCFAHRDMAPGGEAAAAGPGVPLPPPPPPPPAPAIVGLHNDAHSTQAPCFLQHVHTCKLPCRQQARVSVLS
jgi:hypothetical protein